MVEKTPPFSEKCAAPSGRSKPALALTILFIVAVVIRLAAGQWASGGLDRELEADEPNYFIRAVNLVEGRGLADEEGRPSSERTPGLPLLLALLFSAFGPDITLARVMMCIMGALLVPACYLLGESVAGRRAGSLCALAAVIFPNWVWYSSFLLTDIPSAVSTVFLAWSLIEGYRRDSPRWFALAGVIGGIGVLIRPTGVVFLPGIIVWILLAMRGRRRRFEASALLFVTFACVLAPLAVRNTLVQGEFVPVSTKAGTELYIANNPGATGILTYDFRLYSEELSRIYPRSRYPNEARRSAMYRKDAERFIRENPGRFLRLCLIRFVEFWKVYSPRVRLWQNLLTILSFGLALPFALLHAVRCGWRRGPTMLLIILIASQTAVNMVFTSIIRYRIPIEPLVIVLASAGLVWIYDRMRDRIPNLLSRTDPT